MTKRKRYRKKMPRWAKTRTASGYGIVVVFLGLFLFALLLAAIMWMSQPVMTWQSTYYPASTGVYDPNTDTAMNMILYPGLAIMVLFGAVIEVINVSQRKSSTEDYI